MNRAFGKEGVGQVFDAKVGEVDTVPLSVSGSVGRRLLLRSPNPV
jgi:hypothetical protein